MDLWPVFFRQLLLARDFGEIGARLQSSVRLELSALFFVRSIGLNWQASGRLAQVAAGARCCDIRVYNCVNASAVDRSDVTALSPGGSFRV